MLSKERRAKARVNQSCKAVVNQTCKARVNQTCKPVNPETIAEAGWKQIPGTVSVAGVQPLGLPLTPTGSACNSFETLPLDVQIEPGTSPDDAGCDLVDYAELQEDYPIKTHKPQVDDA